jgi:hypothetical protein
MHMTEFEKRTHEVLEESAGRLDGRTRSRLTQARHAALARLERPARGFWRSYAPAGAAAPWQCSESSSGQGQAIEKKQLAPGSSPVEDIELLADADASDFVDDAEELEFYEWAAGEVES